MCVGGDKDVLGRKTSKNLTIGEGGDDYSGLESNDLLSFQLEPRDFN